MGGRGVLSCVFSQQDPEYSALVLGKGYEMEVLVCII